MSRTRPRILLAGALVGALALTGCGAGQVANTAEQVGNSRGANAAVGTISVRDAVILYGESVEGPVYERGESAPLEMRIVNEGGDADRLVAATSPLARSVEVTGEAEVPAGRVLVVGGEGEPTGVAATSSAPVPPTPVATAEPSPGAPGAPPVTPPAAPPAAPPATAAPSSGAPSSGAQASGAASAGEGVTVVLTELADDIQGGVSYPVTLTFERAGQLTVQIPVGTTDEPREAADE